jgi:hypothetical protein
MWGINMVNQNLNQNKMEKTTVEWLFEKLWNTDKDKLTWHSLLETALEMEAKQQQLDLTNITRLEVINHAKNDHPIGRILTLYKETEDFTVVDAEFQDGGRTLKIFIS